MQGNEVERRPYAIGGEAPDDTVAYTLVAQNETVKVAVVFAVSGYKRPAHCTVPAASRSARLSWYCAQRHGGRR
jgi:hypothetical protein